MARCSALSRSRSWYSVTRSSVVVDPGEERLKSEFADVKRTYLPLQSVIRIDEVRKQGVSKIVALEGSNVAHLPVPLLPPSGSDPGTKKT